ncbi:hypothetical protein EVAR_8261_1 [Eumeta japonica]|uniref:Uncharacterized protein n=1 Tax=Eumeta variegata TaxID=151549 RepID=A0A4C1TFU7_EUMVA|nr:hypothetical protein EVAR_8261_1 [Eumeta japonica]
MGRNPLRRTSRSDTCSHGQRVAQTRMAIKVEDQYDSLFLGSARSFIDPNHNILETPGTQCAWNEIIIKTSLERLLKEAPDDTNKARLRAALISES